MNKSEHPCIVSLVLGLVVTLATLPAMAAEPMHSAKSKSQSIVFIPAFVPCQGVCIGGDVEGAPCGFDEDCAVGGFCRDRYDALVTPRPTNTATPEEGVPACGPSMTFNEQAGSPPNGWVAGRKAKRMLKAKRKSGDVTVQLKLSDIHDSFGPVDGASGTLSLVIRLRRLNPTIGDMSVADIPLSFTIPPLVKGKGGLKSSLNEALGVLFSNIGDEEAGSVSIVKIEIRDPNGTPFAVPGIGDEDAGNVRVSLEGPPGVPGACGAGTTNCSGFCANLQTDTGHCGSCGTKCTAGQTCTAGVCG